MWIDLAKDLVLVGFVALLAALLMGRWEAGHDRVRWNELVAKDDAGTLTEEERTEMLGMIHG